MSILYDKYYQQEDLFGAPYPELVQFFMQYPTKGKLVDVGCGQGRNAIPLARLGYQVKGIDHSKVGMEQMIETAEAEGLDIKGIIADVYEFAEYGEFDFILLDSMFHFFKKDKTKEMDLVGRILNGAKSGSIIIFCIQNTGKKLEILKKAIASTSNTEKYFEKNFQYKFVDEESVHSSTSDYTMLALRKND